MKTRISSDNPFGYNRYGYAWENIPPGTRAHLDFGCYHGRLLGVLGGKTDGMLAGADVSSDAIDEARERYKDIDLVCTAGDGKLPYEDGRFSSITLLDVIEHVDDQIGVLKELRRVMADDGVLIVTVPGKHVFSFLDMGNFKFCFPRLHRWYFCRNHSRREYEHRYVANEAGLTGDVSVKKGIHEHFSRRKMEKLLNRAGFAVAAFDGSGLFYRPISIMRHLLRKVRPVSSMLAGLMETDAGIFGCANLYCVAKKQRPAEPGL